MRTASKYKKHRQNEDCFFIRLISGKVERQLYVLGRYNQKTVIDTFLQAIKMSYAFDHDLG